MLRKAFHIRDLSGALPDGTDVHFKCLILKRKVVKKYLLFMTVQDESGICQVVFKKGMHDDKDWERLTLFRNGDPVVIKGTTTSDFNSASVLGSTAEVLGDEPITIGRQHISMGSAVSYAYLARLKNNIIVHLKNQLFEEVDTRLISSAPPSFPGAYPLKIHYDGYGADFHIVPTPVSQLIHTLSSAPYERVFSVGRCFTQGYRDPVVSVESLVISMAARRMDITSLLKIVDSISREILLQQPTGEDLPNDIGKLRVVEITNISAATTPAVSSSQIQLFQIEDSDQEMTAGRLCWPCSGDNSEPFKEFVVAEGYAAGDSQNPAYSVITINVDRLMSVLFEFTDIRRIPTLSKMN